MHLAIKPFDQPTEATWGGHPGVVPTKFAAALVGNKEDERAIKDATYLDRLGRPEDIAAAVAFLSSSDAAYITAETLLVTGGMQSRL